MTPSTTNTAAREVDEALLDRACAAYDAARWTGRREDMDLTASTKHRAAIAAVLILAQQQGGEQEAGEHAKVLALLRAGYRVDLPERTAAYNAAIAALRTKQPAASEGDVRLHSVKQVVEHFGMAGDVAAEIMLYANDEAQCWDAAGQKWIVQRDKLRDWAARLANTSKQAAGEAVAWQIMRAAFVTADENYSGKRVAAVYADASMIGQRVRLIFDTTPPRHPADEGVAHQAQLASLQSLAACAYQLAGYHDAPEIWLDRLSEAANGDALPDADTLMDELLPYAPA